MWPIKLCLLWIYIHQMESHDPANSTEYSTYAQDFKHQPDYYFSYGVNEEATGDVKSQWEKRNGNTVKGQYSVVQPDGIVRTVDYNVVGDSGFNAIIKTEGKNSPTVIESIPKGTNIVVPSESRKSPEISQNAEESRQINVKLNFPHNDDDQTQETQASQTYSSHTPSRLRNKYTNNNEHGRQSSEENETEAYTSKIFQNSAVELDWNKKMPNATYLNQDIHIHIEDDRRKDIGTEKQNPYKEFQKHENSNQSNLRFYPWIKQNELKFEKGGGVSQNEDLSQYTILPYKTQLIDNPIQYIPKSMQYIIPKYIVKPTVMKNPLREYIAYIPQKSYKTEFIPQIQQLRLSNVVTQKTVPRLAMENIFFRYPHHQAVLYGDSREKGSENMNPEHQRGSIAFGVSSVPGLYTTPGLENYSTKRKSTVIRIPKQFYFNYIKGNPLNSQRNAPSLEGYSYTRPTYQLPD